MARNFSTAFVAFALVFQACNGPWNIEPESPEPLALRVSGMPVSGRPYDTIWIERIQPIALETRGLDFVKSGSWLRIVRVDGNRQDTVLYARSARMPRAWIPLSGDTVPYGAELRLEGHVIWNSSTDFPSGDETAVSDISATTALLRTYRMSKEALAPLDVFFKTLSVPGYSTSASELLAALKIEDGATVARLSVNEATCDSFVDGKFVLRSIHSGDSIWSILDDALVEGPTGGQVKRSLRPIMVSQVVDRERWGGLISSIGFDPKRARILGPIERVGFQIRGDWNVGYEDSVAMFQPGNSRMLAVDPPDQESMLGYPESMQLPQMVLSYTGRNVVRGLAMDRTYATYHNTMMNNESGAWNYSSVHGADGYFAGAAADSLEFFVKSARDTFAVDALRRTWCRELSKTPVRQRAAWTVGVDCAGG